MGFGKANHSSRTKHKPGRTPGSGTPKPKRRVFAKAGDARCRAASVHTC